MARGGKRPGAGRPSGHINRKTALRIALAKPPETKQAVQEYLSERQRLRDRLIRKPESAAAKAVKAAEILATVEETGLWHEHLFSLDPKVAFWALQYLTDQRDGKPAPRKEASKTDSLANRSDAELEYFIQHGCWPEETDVTQ